MSGYGDEGVYGALFYKGEVYDSTFANPPFFRYEEKYLRHTTGVQAPSFPSHIGLMLHSYITKPDYGSTNRKHGTTAFTWATEGVKQTDRNTIQDFWETDISDGYENFTVVDHRRRVLFEASWNDWQERWTKRNGGTYQIDYNIESPIPWTPPAFGVYPMTINNLVDHNLSGNDLAIDDGTFVQNSTDSNVLRLNGYALKLTGT